MKEEEEKNIQLIALPPCFETTDYLYNLGPLLSLHLTEPTAGVKLPLLQRQRSRV